MTRLKLSMPLKIALLLFAGVVIIVFSGYLSYKSISSVVPMIYNNNTPGDGLATIRDITTTTHRAPRAPVACCSTRWSSPPTGRSPVI